MKKQSSITKGSKSEALITIDLAETRQDFAKAAEIAMGWATMPLIELKDEDHTAEISALGIAVVGASAVAGAYATAELTDLVASFF